MNNKEESKIPNTFARKRKKTLNNKSKQLIDQFIKEEIELRNEWSGNINNQLLTENFNNNKEKLTVNKINEIIVPLN